MGVPTTPCREWHAANVKGYGYRWDRKRKRVVLIHRWVVAQLLGWDAIEGRVVMHLCDNPACYRYDHLRVATQDDNMRDAWEKGHTEGAFVTRTHCKRGHEFNEANTYVNPDGDRECRRCRADATARSRRGRLLRES
jgi:hypothetical protein